MRIGSLFSGIGGLELGLERAGVGHTVWQVEQDAGCRGILARHWPQAERFDDVRTAGAANLAAVDVVCGGYPCQPFSSAGLRRGEADPRHLWPEFARILRELRPRYAVLENVAAHLELGFPAVLADLADLGFDAEWDVVSACSVGAPHARERLFVVAYATGERRPQVVSRPTIVSPPTDSRWSAGNADPRRGAAERLSELERVCGQPAILGDGDGVPEWMDELHALGNAVVPHVGEIAGRVLLDIDSQLREAAA